MGTKGWRTEDERTKDERPKVVKTIEGRTNKIRHIIKYGW